MVFGVKSNLRLGSLVGTIGIVSGNKYRPISACATEVFLDFDLDGLTKSEKEILCFPKECNFDAGRELESFVGKAEEEAQAKLSSVQALAASLWNREQIN